MLPLGGGIERRCVGSLPPRPRPRVIVCSVIFSSLDPYGGPSFFRRGQIVVSLTVERQGRFVPVARNRDARTSDGLDRRRGKHKLRCLAQMARFELHQCVPHSIRYACYPSEVRIRQAVPVFGMVHRRQIRCQLLIRGARKWDNHAAAQESLLEPIRRIRVFWPGAVGCEDPNNGWRRALGKSPTEVWS